MRKKFDALSKRLNFLRNISTISAVIMIAAGKEIGKHLRKNAGIETQLNNGCRLFFHLDGEIFLHLLCT